MGIKVRSLSGFEAQGSRETGCCGQREQGLGDPIMMLEGFDAITSSRPSSGSPGTAPLPDTTNCRPGEVYDRIEQMCVPMQRDLFQTLTVTKNFVPLQQETPDTPAPGGGTRLPTVSAPPGGSGSSPAPLPLPPATAPEQEGGGLKIAIAAGGFMVVAALFMRGR